MKGHLKEYALYKGDTLLGIGTAPELAKQLGVKVQTIRFYGSPIYRTRVANDAQRRILVDLTDD